jgi:HSP20 family protein
MAASGLKKENFDLVIKEAQLRISYREEVKDQKKESDYARMELNYHSFTRMFTLPESTLSSEIKASYLDGILLVNIPKVKLEKESAKKILVD